MESANQDEVMQPIHKNEEQKIDLEKATSVG